MPAPLVPWEWRGQLAGCSPLPLLSRLQYALPQPHMRRRLHKTLIKQFKYALVWGASARHKPQKARGSMPGSGPPPAAAIAPCGAGLAGAGAAVLCVPAPVTLLLLLGAPPAGGQGARAAGRGCGADCEEDLNPGKVQPRQATELLGCCCRRWLRRMRAACCMPNFMLRIRLWL